MHLKFFIQGIDGIIPGGVSVKDYSTATKIEQSTAKKILDELVENGIGVKQDNLFNFNSSDKLKYALLALQKGALIEEISTHLSWRDFESLVAEVLESKDFATIKNLFLKNPRMEIDVVGIKLGVAILIDCKHWKRYSSSTLNNTVKKQIERTKHYVSQTENALAIPVIVTLYQDKLDFIYKVPIVPIFQFSSFIDEFYGNLDKMETIKSC